MQEFEARNEAKQAPESDGPISRECSRDCLSNPAQCASSSERQGGFTRGRQMDRLTETGLPNTGRRLEQGEGARSVLPAGERHRTASGGEPAMDEASPGGAEDEYYLEFLVCSDVLRDEDKARWEHRLCCPAPLLLPGTPGEAGTAALPQGAGRPTAAPSRLPGSAPWQPSPPPPAMDTSPGGLRQPESPLSPKHQQHPVRPPPSLRKNSTSPAEQGAGGGPAGVQLGSEDNTDHWTVRAEMQPLLSKDGEISFIKNATSSASYKHDPSACHGKKTDLLFLNKCDLVRSHEDNCDHKSECGRLSPYCKTLSNAQIVDNTASKSSAFKEMYHIQDNNQLQEKILCFITKDDELMRISKEYEGSNNGYKAKTDCTRPLIDSSIGDYCIENKNSEHCENSSIYDKELGTLEQPSELYTHNANLPSSIVCNDSKSDMFKIEDTCGCIDPYLDIPPCLTVPVQIQDISRLLNTSSNISLVDGYGSENKFNSPSNVSTNNGNDGPAQATGQLQINKNYDSKSHEMDTTRYECPHLHSKVVCPKAMLQNLNLHKELADEFEQTAFENRKSHESAVKSLSLPLNSTEGQGQIQCSLNASENKLHEENRSTHQSMQLFETADIEAHNNKAGSSFQETSRSVICQLEEQLPIEQPALFEDNLEIRSNKLVFFNNKRDGTDWPLQEMEYKTNSTATEPSVITHQDANTFTLIDNEKLKNDEASPFESLCWNSSREITEGINNEYNSDVTNVEIEGLCKTEKNVNDEHLRNVFHDENMNQQFCNSTEIAMSPVSNRSTEYEHFIFQSRIVQHSNSETVLDLEDHLIALQSNNEPEVVKLDGLQSSMSHMTEQYLSPLIEQNQPRLIKIEANTAGNLMEYMEYPISKEQKSSTVCIPISDQSSSLQEISRPIQNSAEYVAEIDMHNRYGEVQDLENSQIVVTDHLKAPLIDGSILNTTQKSQPILQNANHLEYLSIVAAEEIKATDKICDIDINAAADFKYSDNSSSYFDEDVMLQGEFGHVEKNSGNHNITPARCGRERDHGHVNDKKRSAPENLESATLSVSSVMNVPPVTEQIKDLKVRSTTIGLNEDTQKVKSLHDCKANLSDVSKCCVVNMKEIGGIQLKEHLTKYKEKESAIVAGEYNKTIEHNNFSQLTAVHNVESSIITQPMVGKIMNSSSDAQEDCRDYTKRPRGNNLNKVKSAAIVPNHSLNYIKTDTNTESRRKTCQMFTLPSNITQRFSPDTKIEKSPLTSKNDRSQGEPPTTHTVSIISEGQKKPLTEKSIAFTPSLNRQQTTAVKIKQPLPAARNEELISGTCDKTRFLKTSSEDTRATTETGSLAPSLNDQRKEKPVKRIRLSTDNMGKHPLENSKQAYSSTGKENLGKKIAVFKRVNEKPKEEQSLKFEHKELKSIKCPLKDDHKDSTIIWTKNSIVLTEAERSAGDDSPVSLAIVQTTMKDRGLYQCSLKNKYGSVSCEFDFTTEVLNELLSYQVVEGHGYIESNKHNDLHAFPDSGTGEKIELLQPIIKKELPNECNFDVKMCGSIATEKSHFGEGLHRKAFRTKVIYGLLPLFNSGHRCVLKIHNAISHGTKANSELIKQNYQLAVQECHVQNAARQYGNMFSAEGTLLEGFGEAPEVIPIYLIHRPTNNIPYATVEEELIGEFVKYSVKDGRELNCGRKESEVGLKCCTFQHWVYQWTEGNLLVTDMQGVGMKLTDIGIATSRKGYKGFKGNCSISFIDQFKALHQCNVFCKMMGLKSLNQHKPKTISPVKTQVSKPISWSTKKMPQSPQSTNRIFVKSTFGDKTSQRHL
ncbi:hypothetical protein chiPu_0008950 [Chiloscyllium punctatum]|uniref:non-specific serine/threonine protein kinase n=1 Tax=Chiloscyllium punctatum TaxID=137246 RepID=A0A401SJA4_CHIPU|nr:hypothetical protein [Chiloscyllium punctatum]